ncbi:MAG: hypothetical protein Q4C73_08155, partial [Eubacteriales bacterium]|nr:hypothetical protein [Eubacteriales bacterium]
MKQFKQKIAFLMSLIISLSSPAQALTTAYAATKTVRAENTESETWIIPAQSYQQVVEDFATQGVIGTNNQTAMEIDNRALVTRNSDGTYHIKLRYSGYRIHDIVQVVNPEKNEEAMKYVQEVYGMPYISSLHWGDFNIKPFEDFLIFGTTEASVYEDYIAPNINGAANYLYFTKDNEISITQADKEMDTGYIEFDMADLSNYIIINDCYSYSPTSSIADSAFVIDLKEKEAVAVPETLTFSPGAYVMGYDWTNYISGKEQSINVRNSDNTVQEYLYSVFENEVSVTIGESGELEAVFTIKQDITNPPVSIVVAENRDTSRGTIGSLKTSRKWAYGKDLMGITYSDNLLENNSEANQVSISFKDLFDGNIIKIQSGSGTTYFGHLWLTEGVRSDSQEITVEDKGVILNGNTNALPGFSSFEVLNPTLEDAGDSIQEGTAKAIKAFSKTDESYRVYQYRIYDKNQHRIEPDGRFTIDFPIPDDFEFESTVYLYASEKNSLVNGGYGLPSGETEFIELNGKKYLRLSPKNLSDAYYTIVMYDQGAPLSSEDLAVLEEGYYKVRPTLGLISEGMTDRPSMSAAAIKDREAVLEVVKKGEEYNLYFDLNGVMAAGSYGYVYKWLTYQGADQNI